MKKPSKKVVSVLLPIELYEEIEKLAEYTQRSKSAYIRQVLRIYLRYYAEHAEEADVYKRQPHGREVVHIIRHQLIQGGFIRF